MAPCPLLCSEKPGEGVAMWGSCFQRDLGKLEQEHGVNVKLGVHVYVLSRFSRVRLFVALWTVAHRAPLSMGFSRQEYCSGLPCPPPGALSDPGVKSKFPASPALQANSLLTEPSGKPMQDNWYLLNFFL